MPVCTMLPFQSNPNTSPDIPSLPLTIQSDLFRRRAQSKEADLDRDFADYDTLSNSDEDTVSIQNSLYLDSAVFIVRSELEQKLIIDKSNAAHQYQQKYGVTAGMSLENMVCSRCGDGFEPHEKIVNS
ncbi:hypothetical protein AMK59_762, partial [Oryctes borbonicus]